MTPPPGMVWRNGGDTMHWLMRMAQWVRHPPSPQRVKLVLVVVAICILLVGVEALGLWPDAWEVNRLRR